MPMPQPLHGGPSPLRLAALVLCLAGCSKGGTAGSDEGFTCVKDEMDMIHEGIRMCRLEAAAKIQGAWCSRVQLVKFYHPSGMLAACALDRDSVVAGFTLPEGTALSLAESGLIKSLVTFGKMADVGPHRCASAAFYPSGRLEVCLHEGAKTQTCFSEDGERKPCGDRGWSGAKDSAVE
jgi:hypothetical protein